MGVRQVVEDDVPHQQRLQLATVELHPSEGQAVLEPSRELGDGCGVSDALGREDDRDVIIKRECPSPGHRRVCLEFPENI